MDIGTKTKEDLVFLSQCYAHRTYANAIIHIVEDKKIPTGIISSGNFYIHEVETDEYFPVTNLVVDLITIGRIQLQAHVDHQLQPSSLFSYTYFLMQDKQATITPTY